MYSLHQYWEGPKPAFVQVCEEIAQITNGPILRVHGPGEIDVGKDISNLAVQQKADIIRLHLLYHYGGIWTDSDCLLIHNLEHVFDLVDYYDFVGYTEIPQIGEHITPNGWMASRPRSPFIKAAYELALKKLENPEPGWSVYGSDILTDLISTNRYRVFRYPYYVICPIVLHEADKFFHRDSREKHFYHFEKLKNPISVMLYNSCGHGFKSLTREDMFESDMFISYLVRYAKQGM